MWHRKPKRLSESNAVESTSHCHLGIVEQALALDVEVCLINARQLVHYRKAVGERNKTDASDALLLARYLDRERNELRRYHPASRQAQLLWTLIKRRAKVVETKKQLRQSLEPIMPGAPPCAASMCSLRVSIDASTT